MRILIQITEETIRNNVMDSVTDCMDNGWIAFPDNASMEQFVTDCTQSVMDSYETSEYYPRPYVPDYTDIVMDNAKWDGYLTEGGE